MRKIVMLSGCAVVAVSLALFPSASYSASKGRSAASSPSKSVGSSGGTGIAAKTKKPKEKPMEYYNVKFQDVMVTGRRAPKKNFQEIPATKRMDRASPR